MQTRLETAGIGMWPSHCSLRASNCFTTAASRDIESCLCGCHSRLLQAFGSLTNAIAKMLQERQNPELSLRQSVSPGPKTLYSASPAFQSHHHRPCLRLSSFCCSSHPRQSVSPSLQASHFPTAERSDCDCPKRYKHLHRNDMVAS